jgi:hypothetical protein
MVLQRPSVPRSNIHGRNGRKEKVRVAREVGYVVGFDSLGDGMDGAVQVAWIAWALLLCS